MKTTIHPLSEYRMTDTNRLNAWVRQCVAAPEHDINRAEVRRALSIFVEPEQTFYVQGLRSLHWHECHGSRLDEAVEAVYNVSDGIGVYFVMNPCKSGLASMPHVGDVLSRRWLLIDIDRRRKKGDPETNATEAEKLAVVEVAYKISDWLWELDWPNPVMSDSGNGTHLFYRVDLPNDPLSRALLKSVLVEAEKRFGTPAVHIDPVVVDARRIAKLPGTWARKGPHSEDRPHRLARLVMVPDPIAVVTVDQLNEVGRALPPTLYGAPQPSSHAHGIGKLIHGTNGTDLTHYVQTAIDRECGRVELTPEGGRNAALNTAAFNLGLMAHWPEMLLCDARAILLAAALRSGLGELESRRTIESGWTSGASKPRDRPTPAGKPKLKITTPDGTSPILWANTVKPRQVEWIWEQGIPRRKLTTFAGVGGLGKTFLLCDIAARISQGAEWPCSGGLCAKRGIVLFISGEDDIDDTLVPRLMELGADLSRIAFLVPEALDRFTLGDIAALDRMADVIGRELSVVMIDPPTSYLNGVDDHNNADLRGLLTPLKNWVSRRECGMNFNTHLNKAQGKVDAMMRVMGSVAWVNAVRAAHMIAKDPNDPTRRLFVPMKNNLGPERKGLAFRIKPTADLATVEWIGEVDTTADEAMSQDRKQPRTMDACECLIEMFNKQLEWPGDMFWAYLNQSGVKRDGYNQARAKLGIPRARRTVNSDGDVMYVFWVPPVWPHLTKNSRKRLDLRTDY